MGSKMHGFAPGFPRLILPPSSVDTSLTGVAGKVQQQNASSDRHFMHPKSLSKRRLTERLSPKLWKRLPRFAFSILSRIDGSHREMQTFFREHHLGLFETLDRVRRDRVSLARLGDGELAIARDAEFRLAFQMGSPELHAELRSILKGAGTEGAPLLVCIPGLAVPYYRRYWAKYWSRVKPMLNAATVYGDISVSREGLFRLGAEKARAAWRSIWDGRDVCYVVGKGSRFDPIDELFGGVASHRTILSKPANAYDDVARLVDEIVATVPRETLLLIALGPAATVLAARLSRLGYWALDIGHITSAYRTVTQGAPAPEKTPLLKNS